MVKAPFSSPNTITLITSPIFSNPMFFQKCSVWGSLNFDNISNTGISIPKTEVLSSRCSRLQLSATETELCFKVLKGVFVFMSRYVYRCFNCICPDVFRNCGISFFHHWYGGSRTLRLLELQHFFSVKIKFKGRTKLFTFLARRYWQKTTTTKQTQNKFL